MLTVTPTVMDAEEEMPIPETFTHTDTEESAHRLNTHTLLETIPVRILSVPMMLLPDQLILVRPTELSELPSRPHLFHVPLLPTLTSRDTALVL